MIIQLVAFEQGLSHIKRRNSVQSIICADMADLILFPGDTLDGEDDLAYIQRDIRHTESTAIVELKQADYHFRSQIHSLRRIESGTIIDPHTGQWFSRSQELGEDPSLVRDYLLYELPKRRFICDNHNVVVIQCGENNLVTTPQTEGYQPRFRFVDDEDMSSAFNNILNTTHIVLNPMHTVQHRHYAERCRFLSQGRYYFGTANADDSVALGEALCIGYHNGKKLIATPGPFVKDRFYSCFFDIN